MVLKKNLSHFNTQDYEIDKVNIFGQKMWPKKKSPKKGVALITKKSPHVSHKNKTCNLYPVYDSMGHDNQYTKYIKE